MNERGIEKPRDDFDYELDALWRELKAVEHRSTVIAMNTAHKIADLEYRIALCIEKRNERLR